LRPWIWAVVAGVAVLAVAALMWYLSGTPAGPAATVRVAAVASPAAVPSPAAVAPAAITAPAAIVAPAPSVEPRPAPPQVAPRPRPAAPPAPRPIAAPPVFEAPAVAPNAKPEATVATSAAMASAALPGTRIYALSELPDDIRRQLPATNVGGSMYSATKANRILILNGQVLHEGDTVAPQLVLHEIRLKAAVLAYKGYRYEIAF
jgi:general secretion pathway protein B